MSLPVIPKKSARKRIGRNIAQVLCYNFIFASFATFEVFAATPNFIVHTDASFARPYSVSNTGWVAGTSRRRTACGRNSGSLGRSFPVITDDSLNRYQPACADSVLLDAIYFSFTEVNDSGWAVGVNSNGSGFRFKDAVQSGARRSFLSRGDTTFFMGLFGNATTTVFQSINEAGQIAGSNTGISFDGFAVTQAAVFENKATTVRSLGALSGGRTSLAYDINNNGVVVGESQRKVNDRMEVHAFIWTGGAITDLRTLAGDTISRAVAINDNGVAVGYSWDRGNYLSGGARAVKWEGGAISALETLPGATMSFAFDINVHGEIVGQISDSVRWHAVLWLPAANYGLDAGLHKLDDVTGQSSSGSNSRMLRQATSISDNGLISCLGWQSGLSVDFGYVLKRPTIVNSASDADDANLADGKCETGTPGECTLRAALQQANLTRRFSYIVFDIPGGGAGGPIIQVQSQLPTVVNDVTIDGSTQPGSGMVNLDGSLLSDSSVSGLLLSGFDPRVRGFGIGRFPGNGITIGPAPENPDEDEFGGTIEDCRIGVGPDGVSDWGNGGHGIGTIGDDNGITIGDGDFFGLDPASNSLPHGNVIANNGGAGIFISSRAAVRGNTIYNNGRMGIDIAPEGPRFNVPGERFNYPEIDSTRVNGGTSTVYGILGRGVFQNPNTHGWTRFLELYLNSECDASGFGEGRVRLHSDSLKFDPDGFARFTFSFPTPSQDRWFVSATMSDNSSTSEFSPCALPPMIVNSLEDSPDLTPADNVCWTGNILPDGSLECTFRAALETANQLPGPDEIAFEIDVIGLPTLRPATAYPNITEVVRIIGGTQPSVGNVEIDGSLIPSGALSNGLTVIGARADISGLLISNFPGNGILIEDGANSFIHNNSIGTDTNGVVDKGNGINGIYIKSSSQNRIGDGADFELSNFVNFNGASGVFVEDGSFNTVRDNVIEGNDSAGVFVSSGSGNSIRRNSIDSNGGLGIDLAPSGVTVADSLDLDTGANGLANYPLFRNITVNKNSSGVAVSTTVEGVISASPSTRYEIEFFVNEACDASSFGEGLLFVSSLSKSVRTDASGFGEFSVTSDEFIFDFAKFLTATATDAVGNTSEFSPCASGPIVVNSASDLLDDNLDDGICWTGVMLANGEKECSFRAAIQTSNVGPNVEQIEFNIPTADSLEVSIISPITELPHITDAVSIVGESQPSLGGVVISGANISFGIGIDGLTITSGASRISGLRIAEFSGNGLVLRDKGRNTVVKSIIGVEIGANDTDTGNGLHGIYIQNSSNNVIGSNTQIGQPVDTSLQNQISENAGSGVYIESGEGNKVNGNIISSNGGSGVFVQQGSGNSISLNSIVGNVGLGIDLAPEGLTQNDPLDLDTGPNDLLNHPFIDSTVVDTSNVGGPVITNIWGHVDAAPGTPYLIELFGNETCESFATSNGTISIGQAFAFTDAGGFGVFVAPAIGFERSVTPFVTATLTDIAGNTSEFSPCSSSPIVVNSTGDLPDLSPTDGVCWTGLLTPDGQQECTFRAAIEFANATPGVDGIVFNITGDSIPTIKPQSPLPAITEAVEILGETQPDGFIELSGAVAPTNRSGSPAIATDGLTITSTGVTISGLVINRFSGNGVTLQGEGGNAILNCIIGTNPDEDSTLGNVGHGVFVTSSTGNLIGVPGSSGSNTLAFNKKSGIFIESGVSNQFRGNRIYSNGQLGIDLAPVGVTANDASDEDVGANGLQNYPVVDSVEIDAVTTIRGSFKAKAGLSYQIDVYVSEECDASGFGEGKAMIHSAFVTGAGPETQFAIVTPIPPPPGTYLTVTATDPNGNTSEFSPCVSAGQIRLVDGNDSPIAEKSFALFTVADDAPLFTETFVTNITTDVLGIVNTTELAIEDGDRLRFYKQLSATNSPKRTSLPKTSFSVNLDNAQFDSSSSEMSYFEMSNDMMRTDLFKDIKMSHTTVAFNLYVSIEFDATIAYVNNLQNAFRLASNYLYDVTDGQSRLDTVFITDNKVGWNIADVWVHASNMEWPRAVANGLLTNGAFDRFHMPRKFYGNKVDNRNRSALENPLNTATPNSYRTFIHELGHYAFNFLDEYVYVDGLGKCVLIDEYGFMESQYPGGVTRSEMSSSGEYAFSVCQNTNQFALRGESCWESFQRTYQKSYAGVFAEIILPEERTFPESRIFLLGPNDNLASPDVDVGAKIVFLGAHSAPGIPPKRYRLVASDGTTNAGNVAVTQIITASRRIVKQGKTADDGRIYFMGAPSAYTYSASGVSSVTAATGARASAAGEFAWSFGSGALPANPEDSIVLNEVQGEFPLIPRVTLSATGIQYSLRPLNQLSAVTLLVVTTDSQLIETSILAFDGNEYRAAVGEISSATFNFRVHANDNAPQTYFFDSEVSIIDVNASSSMGRTSGLQASVSLNLDSSNTATRQVILTTDYPPIRNGLAPAQIQASKVVVVQAFPAITTLSGPNSLQIRYPEGNAVSNGIDSPLELTLRIHHWDDALGKWTAIDGTVDTSQNEVSAEITELGTYALFTTDIQTDVDDDSDTETGTLLPKRFEVHQNFPNPFNPTTVISYSLPIKAEVTVVIYNVLGQKVRVFDQGQQSAGEYSVTWNATDEHGKEVASGMYFYKVTAGEFSASRKMVLLK